MSYAPLLTRSAFMKTPAAQKVGASYEGYKSYVTHRRAKRAAVAAADPVGTALARVNALISSYKPAAIANSGVNAQIKQGTADINAASTADRQQAADQAKRAQGFALALANLTKTAPEAIGDQYRTEADRLRGYGTGLTGAVADAQQAAAGDTAQHLADVGLSGSSVGSFDPASLRSSLQMTGVVNPAYTIEQDATRAVLGAKADNAARAGSINDIANQYLQHQQDLQAADRAQVTALEKSRPALYQQALQAAQQNQGNLFTNQGNLLNTLIQQQYLANTQTKTNADITGSYVGADGKLHPTASTVAANNKVSTARQKALDKRDSTTSSTLLAARDWVGKQVSPGVATTVVGSAPLKIGTEKLGKQSVPVYAKKGGGKTYTAADAIQVGVPAKTAIPIPTYDRILSQLTNRISTQLKRFGYSNAVLRNMAVSILEDYYTTTSNQPDLPGKVRTTTGPGGTTTTVGP